MDSKLHPSVRPVLISDLRKLESAAFWFVMDNRGWLHPYDERGRRRSHTDLPNSCGPTIFPAGAGLLPTRTAWPSSGENN
jgi:hypothetical protein